MIPLEFYTHMCFHVMHIGLLQLQNDLRKTLWMYVIKFYNVWCQLLSTVFDITHNVQLNYDCNYVNLITYLHHVTKLHM